MPKLIFFMIARREEEIILRLLDSVKKYCDAIYISRNGTQEEIESECKMENLVHEYCEENKLPCKIDAVLWKNFGHNRTLSFHGARQFAKGLGWDLSKSYGLTMDADMQLVVKDENWKDRLEGEVLHLTQMNRGAVYNNTRIISLAKDTKCIGVTHEYWDKPIHLVKILTPDILYIQDNDDGRCKGNKLERDIEYLLKGLETDPNNGRYMFYLAQSYYSCGKFYKAIHWYTKRIKSGGFKSEVWFSHFHRAMCYHELGNKESAISCMLDAYNFEPERTESLYHLARWYREKGMSHVALLFAMKAHELPMPDPQHHLFIDSDVYKYKILFELGLNSFYVPKLRDLGQKSSLELYNRAVKNNHEWYKTQAVYLLSFYAQRLKPNSMKIKFDKTEEFDGNGIKGTLGFLGDKIYFEEN